jgi:hypothetical protein
VRGTPVAVTNPIRMKDSQNDHRLPRDILKKYEGKSREVKKTFEFYINTVDQDEFDNRILSIRVHFYYLGNYRTLLRSL